MRDIALLIIVGGLLPVCLVRPWIGMLLYMWLSFMNPHRLTFGFAQTMPWAFAVALVTLIGLAITHDRKRIQWNTPLILMALCALYFTLTTFTAMAQTEAWRAWNQFEKIILMSVVLPFAIYGRDRIKLTVVVAALSIGFFGFKGGIFTITHGGVSQIRGPEGSFIEDNNSIGLALVMVVPLLHWLAGQETRKWLARSYLVTMWLSMLSAVFTYSRGALVGLAVIAPLLLLRTRRKVLVVLLLVPLAYFGKDWVPEELYSRAESIENYQTDTSAMLRFQSWGVALNVAREHPLSGGGFSFEYIADARWLAYAPFLVEGANNYARAAHSIYFQALGNHGFVGFGLFVAMLISTLLAFRRIMAQAKKSPETEWIGRLASGLQISLVAYMVSGAFLSLAYFDLPYLLISLSAILQRELATRGVASESARAGEPKPSLIPPGAIVGTSRTEGPLRRQ
ncbi:MAG: putative O-glycosylation ligase, exosortase A system-associated [Gemmatimonadota bacterium]|nr:putative O-glycosylation ligase, exosortase A system-associated [Gemmatimonadota bacterium]